MVKKLCGLVLVCVCAAMQPYVPVNIITNMSGWRGEKKKKVAKNQGSRSADLQKGRTKVNSACKTWLIPGCYVSVSKGLTGLYSKRLEKHKA